MMTTITKADLEAIVEGVTNIPCADSPLQQSWVREALEGGGDGTVVEPAAAAEALDRLAGDVEGFADALSQRYANGQRPTIARQEISSRTIYEPCLPDGDGHHECVGKGIPADGDSSAIGPCECTCH
ncbi:MAG: hypothetical protein IH975_09650, partial [Nitrospinae bacterium]|nr:hypothetical protein [Nitrospinota bacterium]